MPDLETASRGFPAVFDHGKKVADGAFAEWMEKERLHVQISYDFAGQHRVEEKGVFRPEPTLVQEQWSWRELKNGQVMREFTVDFQTGVATWKNREDGTLKTSSKTVKVEPGRTFAGFGFSLAVKAIRERLVAGQKIELLAVAFSPKARVIPVDISYGGLDKLKMGGRIVTGDRFIIHPKVPLLAQPFVDVEDTKIWLTPPRPCSFLRFEGALAAPGDPLIRVDLLPGEQSDAAVPVSTK